MPADTTPINDLERLRNLLVQARRDYLKSALDEHDASVKIREQTQHVEILDPLKLAGRIREYGDAIEAVDNAISLEDTFR